jgi:Bifunctional DNA primase/polymerase, N-terminal
MSSSRHCHWPDDDTVVRAALDYAAHGWAVFPVHGIVDGRCGCGTSDCLSPGKHPLTRHGLKEATTDARVVADWWKKWPLGNVALAAGRASGLVVVDIDVPEGEHSLTKLFDAGYELPETSSVRTGSGGLHLYYSAPGSPIGNTAGRLPGVGLKLPGVDLRGQGGYVVAPPSLHTTGSRYLWMENDVELAEAPAWLAPVEARKELPAPPTMVAAGASTPYGLAALRGELEVLRRAPVGTRNHVLNRCAFRLGRLVAGSELLQSDVVAALRAQGLSRGLTAREVERTISSGLAAGARQPRSRPRS